MSVSTGCMVNQIHATALPIPDDVIDLINHK